jgi:cytochrome c-type biogenesis protein CcmH
MVWILGALASLIAIYVIARPILAARDVDIGAGTKNLKLYKDQLTEVDTDLARGVLSADDADAARLEISRRILAADKHAQNEVGGKTASSTANKVLVGVIALSVLGMGLGVYAGLGKPNMPDRPLAARLTAMKQARANRPTQAEMEGRVGDLEIDVAPDYIKLVEQLRTAVTKNPTDIDGLRLLALHEFRLGRYAASRVAQMQIMKLLGETATAKDHSDYAEVMVVAANGYVSPQAELALSTTLEVDPTDGRARYYSGLALIQNGRADVAHRLWSGLLAEGPDDAPWIPLIKSQIDQVARAAGITTAPGPDAAQVEAASDMSQGDRNDMIRGMVNGLGERLATEGGTADEWARLIRALGVLGETGRASAIWKEAQSVFDGQPTELNLLLEAAQAAEVAN